MKSSDTRRWHCHLLLVKVEQKKAEDRSQNQDRNNSEITPKPACKQDKYFLCLHAGTLYLLRRILTLPSCAGSRNTLLRQERRSKHQQPPQQWPDLIPLLLHRPVWAAAARTSVPISVYFSMAWKRSRRGQYMQHKETTIHPLSGFGKKNEPNRAFSDWTHRLVIR